jgi:hypothetical protein
MCMLRISPTMEGFRVVFRRPLLTLAEISWRWAVGATATALFFFGLFEYLSSLPVSRREMLFLRSRQPYLAGQAILHILRGSLSRAVLSLLVAILLVTLIWALAGTLGRIATLRALLEYFRGRFVQGLSAQSENLEGTRAGQATEHGNLFSPLMFLNLLRAVLTLAAVVGFGGAIVLAGLVSPDAHPRPGLAFVVFVPVAGLVCVFWSALNWMLSLAAVFVVRDGHDWLAAIAAAMALFRRRTSAVFAVSSWVGVAHLVAFVAATTVVSMPLAFIPLVPWRVAVLAMIFITLVYFAVADWLYMARLAGYVCIVEMTDEMFAPLPPPVPVAPTPLHTSIDRDELILSDLPNLVVET